MPRPDFLPHLGPALRSLRQQRHKTLTALATAAGLGAEELDRYEAGTAFPELPVLDQVLIALGASLAQLHQEIRNLSTLEQLHYALEVAGGTTKARSEEEAIFCHGLVLDMSWRLEARRRLGLPELVAAAGRSHASAA